MALLEDPVIVFSPSFQGPPVWDPLVSESEGARSWNKVLGEQSRCFTDTCRSAIFQALMGSGLAPGDGALFPEYHCGSELDVLEFFGLRIHLFRLHEDLTPDWDDIRDLVRRNPDARLLYLIGYFGRRPDIEKARLVSSELGLELFEDAALTLFSGHGRLTEGHSRMLSLPKFLGVPRGGIIVDGGSTSADGAIDDSVRTGGGLALQLQMKKRVLRRWLPKRKPKKFQNVNDAEPGSEIVLMPRSYRFTREMAKRWGMNSWLESRIRRMDPMEVAAENPLS